jgi:RNA polymerase sigma-70 factor, ECF subfamily
MSSRIARLVFGNLPAPATECSDACLADIREFPDGRASLLDHLSLRLASDEALAQHLQRGNADALTVLFDRHAARVFSVARRILRNDAEAEDAVQQTFLDSFRSIAQFDPAKAAFKTWLLMFAYQRIFNCRRTLTANRFLESDPFDEFLPGLFAASTETRRFSLAESSVLLEQVLQRLQPRQRRTIELVYYEGLTAEEISARTGETVRVVRHNLYRGLEKLRATLGTATARTAKGHAE